MCLRDNIANIDMHIMSSHTMPPDDVTGHLRGGHWSSWPVKTTADYFVSCCCGCQEMYVVSGFEKHAGVQILLCMDRLSPLSSACSAEMHSILLSTQWCYCFTLPLKPAWCPHIIGCMLETMCHLESVINYECTGQVLTHRAQ